MNWKKLVWIAFVAWCCAAQAISDEIRMQALTEVEERLPFRAVDGSGQAVTDLKKSEMVLLVDGINFRGFTLIAPGDASFSDRPGVFAELAKAPPGSHYEIVFPYVWDAGRDIRIQLGTSRPEVRLAAPPSIPKHKSELIIEELKAEVLALELLRENTWKNFDLESLNLFAGAGKPRKRKEDSRNPYQVRLPASYRLNRIQLFRVTFQPEKPEIVVQQQEVVPDAELLQIDRGGEYYLLLLNPQKAAALVLKNTPPSSSAEAELPVRLTPEEKAGVAAAIAERKKTLSILQSESRVIPIGILPAQVLQTAAVAASPAGESAASASEIALVAPAATEGPASPQLKDVKTSILGRLESYRSGLTQTAKSLYCDAAMKYLRQNLVRKALPLLEKAQDASAPVNSSYAATLGQLRKLARFQEEMLDRSASLSRSNLEKKVRKIQPRPGHELTQDESREFFSDLQALIEKNQERYDFVRESLAAILQHLEIAAERSAAATGSRAALSPAGGVPELRKQIQLFLSLSSTIGEKTFIQGAWIVRMMNQLEQILNQYAALAGTAEQCLAALPETMAEAAIRFVMANNRVFSLPFKRSFYEKKMDRLGVPEPWRREPSFFDVILQAREVAQNAQGYWEAVFADDMVMIYVPGGRFTMGVPWESGGAEDESPQHTVSLDAYWIAKFETTFKQYDRFCDETGHNLLSDFNKGRKNRPIIGVSYQNALDYSQWLTTKTGEQFRLPTDEEWEKAARGNDSRTYPWGNLEPNGTLGNFADVNFLRYYRQIHPPESDSEQQQILKWIAGTSDDGHVFTAPVGSYSSGASPCGALDMAGNVWEWVADWYDGNYYQKSPPANPVGSSSGLYRIVRGGGWDCNPWMLRSTTRSGAPPIPDKGSDTIGFRVAASPLPATGPGESPSSRGWE